MENEIKKNLKKYYVFYKSSTKIDFSTNSWDEVENKIKNDNGVIYYSHNRLNSQRGTVKFFDNKEKIQWSPPLNQKREA